jgi:hypothetical protein
MKYWCRPSRMGNLAGLALASLSLACAAGILSSDVIGGNQNNVAVTLSPVAVTLAPSASQQFVATVTGTSNLAVTWSVDENGGGVVSSSGHYDAPAATGSYHVRATSDADPSQSAAALVTVSTTPCTPESNPAFCTSNGKNCDSYSAMDNCGKNRTTNCGTCTSSQTCGAVTPNVCGTASGQTENTTSAASWFSPSLYFNMPIDTAPLDAQSNTIITNLKNSGGWGTGRFQIDFSIDVYYADSSSVRLPFVDGGVYSPDSDIPTTVAVNPISAAGFESSGGKTCDGGDCHYLVVDASTRQLIEMWVASATSSQITSTGSVAVWSMDKVYPASLRGDVCSSADASGGMIAPLLFTAEEVAASHIDHAIRFILPNARIQNKEYVRPATHGTGGTGWAQSGGVPYGARFRLKSSFNTSGLSAGAKVVAAALMKYGMILSDGGNVALTAKSDQFSSTKWSMGALDLSSIQPTDFEMVDASYGSDQVSSSQRFDFTGYNCVRNP